MKPEKILKTVTDGKFAAGFALGIIAGIVVSVIKKGNIAIGSYNGNYYIPNKKKGADNHE